jgi:hypothetical protein
MKELLVALGITVGCTFLLGLFYTETLLLFRLKKR